MTAIAYKNGVMAGDTMAVWEDGPKVLNDVKVHKVEGHLIGMAGDKCPRYTMFIKWLFDTNSKKKSLSRYQFDAMVITPAGEIQIWDETGHMDVHDGEFMAIGSGCDGCMCAMETGASAEQAVAAAIKHVEGVGGEVRTVALDSAMKIETVA